MPMAENPNSLLRTWLTRQVPQAGMAWLHGQLEKLSGTLADRNIHIAFGLIPRRMVRDDLKLTQSDLANAQAARPGWNPQGWSLDEAARVLLLCHVAARYKDFPALFTDLCRTADVQEAVALYKGLPLYPAPKALVAQAAEGVRTNMRSVFEAVAHNNPFPREFFDQDQWNQMVLKALFIGSTLAPIQGLDARANRPLAEILCDYAHERWAAGRPITPELWRCVGPFAEGAALQDLKRALTSTDENERKGAALALSSGPGAEAKAAFNSVPELAALIADGRLTWQSLHTRP